MPEAMAEMLMFYAKEPYHSTHAFWIINKREMLTSAPGTL